MPFEAPKCHCGKSDVQITCPICDENLCHTCDQQMHITPKFKLHKRFPYVGDNLISRFCEIKGHEEVTLNLFCKSCSKIICATCVVKEHKNHDSVPLKEASENLKVELKGFMEPLQVKIQKLEEEIKNAKIAFEEVKTFMDKSEFDILTFVMMVSKFKQEHPYLLNELFPDDDLFPAKSVQKEKPKDGKKAAPGLDVVAGWIKKPFSGWKLLYSISKDETSNRAFHTKCDGKGPTVTVVRTKDGYVFGGYAHLPWNSNNGHKASRESFIFSLTDGKNRPPKQFFPYQNFIYCLLAGIGPCFGGNDLIINLDLLKSGSTYSSLGYTYQTPEGYSYGSEGAKNFLAGKHNNWDIEILDIYLV